MVSEMINGGVVVKLLRAKVALSSNFRLNVADSLISCLGDALVLATHSGFSHSEKCSDCE